MRPLLPVLALLLTGCGGEAAAESSSSSADAPATPAGVVLGPLPAPPLATGDGWHTDFARAFTHGLEIDHGDERITIAVDHLGDLQADDRRTVATADPDMEEPVAVLPLTVPQGRFRVELSRAFVRARTGGDSVALAAAMRLRLGTGRATTWDWVAQITASEGRVALALVDRETPGVTPIAPSAAVDGVTGLTGPGGEALAFAAAGMGPGAYEVYVGRTAAGEAVEVVIDFRVLLEPTFTEAWLESPAHEPPGILTVPALDEVGVEVRRAQPDEVSATTGNPLWFVIDARQNRRDPRIGFPEVSATDEKGRPVEVRTGNEGFRLWVEEPGPADPIPVRLRVAVRTGFTPL
ncbi:MAG: hypothetical protein H6742_22115 [Alphaproteobacteria bacterium]|nr:hypothetical protein [Alphaproteobacteria bacterium]